MSVGVNPLVVLEEEVTVLEVLLREVVDLLDVLDTAVAPAVVMAETTVAVSPEARSGSPDAWPRRRPLWVEYW